MGLEEHQHQIVMNPWPGVMLMVQEEVTYFEPASLPDPDWRYIDTHGHGHFWLPGKGDDPGSWPTLELRTSGCGDPDHGDDCPGRQWWECRFCAESVNPGYRKQAPEPRHTKREYGLQLAPRPGSPWQLTYKFGSDVFVKLCAAITESVERELSPYEIERTFVDE